MLILSLNYDEISEDEGMERHWKDFTLTSSPKEARVSLNLVISVSW